MANQTAKIDENTNQTMLAVTDDEVQEIRRVLVDPATGYLLVKIVP